MGRYGEVERIEENAHGEPQEAHLARLRARARARARVRARAAQQWDLT